MERWKFYQVYHKNDLWGYVDEFCDPVIGRIWSAARPFSEGLAAARDFSERKWGFIDPDGNMVIPCEYKETYC